MVYKAVIICAAVLACTSLTKADTDKVICFFASWADYRNGDGSFKPANIDPNLCTHVLYAFLGVNTDGTLNILDPWNEIDLGQLAKVAALKEDNPDLKVLISVGGWNAGNAILNGIVASTKLRKNLIDSCLDFFYQYDYDGIDIDWEYPTTNDKLNFVRLLQEMREAFDDNGYVLSVTVHGDPLDAYDIPKITEAVDLINIMSYDFHSSSDGHTGFNAALYGIYSVNSSVIAWLGAGANSSKLTLSVPFYGHSYTLASASKHEVGDSATTGIAGPYSQIPGTLGYNEICDFYNDWTRVWDEDAQVPYSYDGTNWLSYDDPESIALKTKYAVDHKLAGVAIWSIDTDDFEGNCGDQDPLLQTINDNLSSLKKMRSA